MKQQGKLIGIILLVSVALVAAYVIGEYEGYSGKEIKLTQEAQAAGGIEKDSKDAAPDRYAYYPGTEALTKEEIRVIACGTGMPAARRGQAATCFLVEAGNGDKFIFDIGSGSMANLAALMIPYQYLDKIFLTHLHTDHMGDIDALWAGGWTAGRPVGRSAERAQGLGAKRHDSGVGYQVLDGSFPETCQLGFHHALIQYQCGTRNYRDHRV